MAEPERYCKGGCGRLIPYAGMGRPRVWCPYCSKDVTRKTAIRKAPRRAICDDFGVVRLYKRCTGCRGWLEVAIENFSVRERNKATGRVMAWQAECRPCLNAKRREGWQRRDPQERRERNRRQVETMRRSPERMERARAQRRERDRLRRARMTEEQREAERARARERYYAAMSDPERRARRAEDRRIIDRMRAMAEGRQPTTFAGALNAYREDMGRGASRLAVEPLAVWLDEVLRREVPDFGRSRGSERQDRSRTAEDLAIELGVPPKRLWVVHRRAQGWVALTTADKMLTNYGRPVTLDGDSMSADLEARCRAMPGNGERILRYMDLAEQVGHLAGTVVDRVEDLWPSLDGAG